MPALIASDYPIAPGRLLICPVLKEWRLTLLVRGEADIDTAEQFRLRLTDAIAAWPYTTVIDLSGLTFCGLDGLDALRAAERAGAAKGREVALVGMSRQLSWLHANVPQIPLPRKMPQASPNHDTVITEGRS